MKDDLTSSVDVEILCYKIAIYLIRYDKAFVAQYLEMCYLLYFVVLR